MLWEKNILKHRKLEKNGRRLRKNFITNRIFQMDLVVLMKKHFFTATKGLWVLLQKLQKEWQYYLDGNDGARVWVPFHRFGNERKKFRRWQLAPKPLKVCHWVWIIKSTRSYSTPWPLIITTICMCRVRRFSSLFINDETLPSEGFNHRKTCV